MKLLMVCLGNICRSPLAEGILRSKLNDDFFVDSAGTISMHEGQHADKRSIQVAKEHGVDISKVISRPFTKSDFETFDFIYCMDLKNLEDVLSMARSEEERQKVKLFLEEAGNYGEDIEVPDPYYGDKSDFEDVYQMLDKAADIVAAKLKSL